MRSSHVHNKSFAENIYSVYGQDERVREKKKAFACKCISRGEYLLVVLSFEKHIVCQVVDMPIPQLDYHILTPALLVSGLATGILKHIYSTFAQRIF